MAKLLLVEDEIALLVLAESILHHAGHETITAASVAEAQAALQAHLDIELVVTDIALRDQQEGGLQVGQFVRQSELKIPVLYVSGQALTDGMQALFVEPSRFLPKPYTDAQLTDAVDTLLNASK